MEWTFTIKQKVAGYELTVSAGVVGKDILLLLQGGDIPHLGCVVQAIIGQLVDAVEKIAAEIVERLV